MSNYYLFRNLPAGSVLEVWAEVSPAAKLSLTAEIEDEQGLLIGSWTSAQLVPGPATLVVSQTRGVVLTCLFQNASEDSARIFARVVDAQGAAIRATRSEIVMRGRQGMQARAYIDAIG